MDGPSHFRSDRPGQKVPRARVQIGSRTDYRCQSSYDYDSYMSVILPRKSHIFGDGLVEVGRGWSVSIKLGSMLGHPTGCHGLPLTASPLRPHRDAVSRLQLRFWLWFRQCVLAASFVPDSISRSVSRLLRRVIPRFHIVALFLLIEKVSEVWLTENHFSPTFLKKLKTFTIFINPDRYSYARSYNCYN